MVKIRLMRVGKRKQPSFRVVVADSRSPRDGRIIESIGHYQPREDPSVIDIDNQRALYWLQQGAQPSDQARKLLQITGAWSEFTGEAPPAGIATPPEPKKRKATPAASVATASEEEVPEEVEAAPPAEAPEAIDEEAAAPEAGAEAEAGAGAEAEDEA